MPVSDFNENLIKTGQGGISGPDDSPFPEGGGVPALEVVGVAKSFGSTEVLKDINFSLNRGETVSIIGSSGSGKTTLLRCINFLEAPDSGIMKLNGKVLIDASEMKTLSDAEKRKKRLHFGLVFQQFNLFPQYTALENVMLAPLLDREADKDEIRERAEHLLSLIGLSEKAGLYPHELSGGQQQRVAIARALAMKPDILCFDEPTSALDPELTNEVLSVIRDLSRQNMTMIIVTHQMDFARDVSHQVLFMDGGMILERGTPDEVFGNPKEERTREFIGSVR